MSFLETVEKARAFLERNGRVSLRALEREFSLDDGALDELIEELVEIQRVAVRDGRALAWAGGVPPALTETSEPERDPRSYTPKHLADKILQSKSALEGERKQVTVLFADVKGSMDLQEGMDPEEWHGIMDRFLQILTEGVHRFEGTVNQYTGDGIMALFGAPIAHEDHAQRACYAALHLSEELRRYATEAGGWAWTRTKPRRWSRRGARLRSSARTREPWPGCSTCTAPRTSSSTVPSRERRSYARSSLSPSRPEIAGSLSLCTSG